MATRIHAPLILTLVMLAILVATLVVGGWLMRTIVADSFRNAEAIRTARIYAASVLGAQLDEETGIRGYATIRQRILIGPYYVGRAAFPSAVVRLRRSLEARHLRQALIALDDAVYVNRRWNQHVAAPLRARRRGGTYLELHGKWLVDRFRIDIARIDAALANEEALTDQRTETATLSGGLFRRHLRRCRRGGGRLGGAAFFGSAVSAQPAARTAARAVGAPAEESRRDAYRARNRAPNCGHAPRGVFTAHLPDVADRELQRGLRSCDRRRQGRRGLVRRAPIIGGSGAHRDRRRHGARHRGRDRHEQGPSALDRRRLARLRPEARSGASQRGAPAR